MKYNTNDVIFNVKLQIKRNFLRAFAAKLTESECSPVAVGDSCKQSLKGCGTVYKFPVWAKKG